MVICCDSPRELIQTVLDSLDEWVEIVSGMKVGREEEEDQGNGPGEGKEKKQRQLRNGKEPTWHSRSRVLNRGFHKGRCDQPCQMLL